MHSVTLLRRCLESAEPMVLRSSHGRGDGQASRLRHDSIHFDATKNRYFGAVSLGFDGTGARVRRKVSGKTKQEVRDKLKALHTDLDAGLCAPADYTVQAALDAWLAEGLSGRSSRTVDLYRAGVAPLADLIGQKQLRKLNAAEVRSALGTLSDRLSARSLQIAHNGLVRAIRHAEAADLVGRNVAALVRPPTGREGRPSKALSLEQARALLAAAAGLDTRVAEPRRRYSLYAYVVLLMTTGMRSEEARALRWNHIDLEAETVAVWRSDRAGGDTKTPKSRRTLKLSKMAVGALRERRALQAADRLESGELWQDTDLVFTTSVGTMLDQHNIRRQFRLITKAAGLGEDCHGSLGIRSSALCPPVACRSRKSPGSWLTNRRALRNLCTGENSGQ